MFTFLGKNYRLYEVRVYIRNEHRRPSFIIYFASFLFGIFSDSIIVSVSTTLLVIFGLHIFFRRLFSYVALRNQFAILSATSEEIVISHKNLLLPLKELYFHSDQIDSFYFDDIFWYSTIGIVMKNKSLITLNFSRGMKNDFVAAKTYLISFARQNQIRVVSGPDKILKNFVVCSVPIYLIYKVVRYCFDIY
ncbi:hypothetical protein EHQ68_08270 [Leptospira congkakensis]|uniref:Uncharacterized protein n=1 Tax=Leptospira congkakensis TaxID=2484932 RepID=A0A4Z1A3Q5_9LEPT|nr:hypothetical protein [Leptospira congkakensis]TGL88626.1 hypothetical protein EHQ69_14340 [Leptospira congkakensis]TGL89212.1 hypothetical protein EHQ68_08270 [Leptospira congkakensis]TGL97180.1 hypothetical protein EHQ70_07765 [Leptospira congkakensis]